eukprot:CAMPEP_0206403656 /NCGR_PEP_ID=MMETSP0294-20121207/27837_1 /ASSEMBLY_ACC=CAM_ASM_000327 /TAXON_ID=39354 /ORGANISM="Heterosigma akashiwo, Strain CCMP2393" /LENGTH=70 /DNA_ID=CAMNT_0053861273 /DNA_START=83 /DNA_END=292 /DNA_ORIENTATION=+
MKKNKKNEIFGGEQCITTKRKKKIQKHSHATSPTNDDVGEREKQRNNTSKDKALSVSPEQVIVSAKKKKE